MISTFVKQYIKISEPLIHKGMWLEILLGTWDEFIPGNAHILEGYECKELIEVLEKGCNIDLTPYVKEALLLKTKDALQMYPEKTFTLGVFIRHMFFHLLGLENWQYGDFLIENQKELNIITEWASPQEITKL